jgi:hypothetical protein
MFLQEYIKLRTEQLRELTHLELDRNLQYVSNPWNPIRSYKEGMVVYFGDTSTGSAGLGWWRANKDNGPSTSFDASDWEPIGASSLSGNILVKDSNNITETTNLLEFSSDFDITFNGVNALVELSSSALGGFWSQIGDTIYYDDNVIIGGDTIFDPLNALTIIGNQLITGDLNVSGFINNINLENFYLDYESHTHTLLPTSFLNYNSVFPNSSGQLADVLITSLTNGDFLQWNSIVNRWVNVQSTVGTHNLGFHNDVASSVSSAPTNNQILIYNTGTSLWENRTLITNNDTGFTGAPFSHNHDIRYWTKAQLSANTGSIINWSNLFNVPSFPSGNSEYVLMTSDVNLPDARILTGTSSISITDNGPNNSVEISVIPETTVQLINVASNNVGIGTRPTINFIDSAFITTTVTDNNIDNRIDILVEFNGITVPEELTDLNDVNTTGALNGDVLVYNSLINVWEPVQLPTAPVTSVNSQTGIVNLGIADLTDTSIVPSNFPGPGSGSPFTPSTNILAYDDDISKWVNITASQLLAGVSSIFLNDILDVNIGTGLSDGFILYYDDISSLWLSGAPSDANLYTITDLQNGALNNLYYTQSELSISGGGSIVHWDNIIGEPGFAPISHTHFLWELNDVEDYSLSLPSDGDILVWDSLLEIWVPQPNTSSSFSIISNSSTSGTYAQTQDITLNPDILNSLEFQSDNGIIIETDSTNNIIKLGVGVDNTTIGFNTDGSLSYIGSNTSFYFQNTAPTGNIDEGSLWYHSITGVLYIFIDDGDTQQWVAPTGSGGQQIQIEQGLGILVETLSSGEIVINTAVDNVTIGYNSDGELTLIGYPEPEVDNITIGYNTQGQLTVLGLESFTTWTWSAGSDSSVVTNSYLKSVGNAYSNVSTYVVAFDCVITAVSAMANESTGWTAELRKNTGTTSGSETIFTLPVASGSGQTAFANMISIPLSAGDRIEFYCNGTSVSFPNISAWFAKS